MSERKVMCPQGHEMILQVAHGLDPVGDHIDVAWYVCECGWRSPDAQARTEQQAIEAAYISATATPPNLPLTREQVEAMDGIDAIWLVGMKSGARYVCAASECLDYEGDWYLYFARKPSPADIAAALEAGKGEGNAD